MDVTTVLRERFGERLRVREPMAKHTNFRVGGPARWYVDVRDIEELRDAIDVARGGGVPWFIFGGGSNTLVADDGFDGLVVQMAMRDVRFDDSRVIAGAGAITAGVAIAAGRKGLSGFEWAVSLPGTIGGAVRGNAGCFGGETKDVVERVRVFNAGTMRIEELEGGACAFRYRHSMFKEHPERIIIEVTLVLEHAQPEIARALMDAFLERRRTTQPHDHPSAGCLFKNIELHDLTSEELAQLDRATAGTWRSVVHHGQLPAGWVIDRLGMKGYRHGGVEISQKHGNFFLNCGAASAADVRAIARAVKHRAREVLGVPLIEEVQQLGFSNDAA